MSYSSRFRHVVSLAGVVREELTNSQGNGTRSGIERERLAGALVELLADQAPQAFRTKIEVLKADPAWASRAKRIDRTLSQSDGAFFFPDLPPSGPGEGYRLRVCMPLRVSSDGKIALDAHFAITDQSLQGLRSEGVPDEVLHHLDDIITRKNIKNKEIQGNKEFLDTLEKTIGEKQTAQYQSKLLKHAYRGSAVKPDTRYGKFEETLIEVPSNPPGLVTPIDVTLPMTQIVGMVTKQDGTALSHAKVRLRGDTHFVASTDEGKYRLGYIRAGKPTLEVTAAKFKPFQQQVLLDAGQTLVIGVQLQPA